MLGTIQDLPFMMDEFSNNSCPAILMRCADAAPRFPIKMLKEPVGRILENLIFGEIRQIALFIALEQGHQPVHNLFRGLLKCDVLLALLDERLLEERMVDRERLNHYV